MNDHLEKTWDLLSIHEQNKTSRLLRHRSRSAKLRDNQWGRMGQFYGRWIESRRIGTGLV